MKTLKTMIVETFIQFHADRSIPKTHISVDYAALDELDGEVPFTRNEGESYITLNIGANAVNNFTVTDNTLCFNASFRQQLYKCYVPTAAISSIYNPDTGEGMPFDIKHDLEEEQKDKLFIAKNVQSQPVKEKTIPSFLTVIK